MDPSYLGKLRELVWPIGTLSANDIQRWHNQGFVFNDELGGRFGLKQSSGGPCGVLAAVQAFMVKYMAFGEDGAGRET